MIELKPGVRVTAMSPQIGLAIQVAAGAWLDAHEEHQGHDLLPPDYKPSWPHLSKPPLVVTSINDGTHSPNSLHWIGHACDIRTKTLPTATAKRWFAAEVRRRLDVDFDVILEGLGTDNEHLHVEYQPKG